jgi:hypothetical protein
MVHSRQDNGLDPEYDQKEQVQESGCFLVDVAQPCFVRPEPRSVDSDLVSPQSSSTVAAADFDYLTDDLTFSVHLTSPCSSVRSFYFLFFSLFLSDPEPIRDLPIFCTLPYGLLSGSLKYLGTA